MEISGINAVSGISNNLINVTKPSDDNIQQANIDAPIVDKIELSQNAVEIRDWINSPLLTVGEYPSNFPTLEGFSNSGLALSLVDSSNQFFSKDMAFLDVAKSARQMIDSKTAQVNSIGFDNKNTNDIRAARNSIYGEFDRRALYAIASNEGNYFTKDEQSSAKSMMDQQEIVMRGYNLTATYVGGGEVGFDLERKSLASERNLLSFLNGVSDEEKSSKSYQELTNHLNEHIAYTAKVLADYNEPETAKKASSSAQIETIEKQKSAAEAALEKLKNSENDTDKLFAEALKKSLEEFQAKIDELNEKAAKEKQLEEKQDSAKDSTADKDSQTENSKVDILV